MHVSASTDFLIAQPQQEKIAAWTFQTSERLFTVPLVIHPCSSADVTCEIDDVTATGCDVAHQQNSVLKKDFYLENNVAVFAVRNFTREGV